MLTFCRTQACGTEIIPQSIQETGFPADRASLQKRVDANDIKAMRAHGWLIWSGLTANSNSSYKGKVLPVWETWLGTEQVFKKPPIESTETPRQILTPGHKFTNPSQFFHDASEKENDVQVVSFNKFDPTMTAYLWSGHPGISGSLPADQKYYYTSTTSEAALNKSWPADTPVIEREVVQAPPTAMELKPVFKVVDSMQLTALPLWRGPNNSTAETCEGVDVAKLRNPQPGESATNCHPTPRTWTHCVLIDSQAETDKLVPATSEQFQQADTRQVPNCALENALYGGINMIYHFKMTAEEATDMGNSQGDLDPRRGDYAVLVAMHVNTKELVQWTWQTFYWMGGTSYADDYPGSGKGRPDSIKGVWRNYDMCVAYSQTTQPGNKGAMRVCFNPFLETSKTIPDGLRSNCVTCHGTARVPAPKPKQFYPTCYDKPVDFGKAGMPFDFGTKTRTDFSWAIVVNSK